MASSAGWTPVAAKRVQAPGGGFQGRAVIGDADGEARFLESLADRRQRQRPGEAG